MRAAILALTIVPVVFSACGGDGDTTSATGGSGGMGASGGAGGSGGAPGCATMIEAQPGTAITRSGAVVGSKQGVTWAYRGIPYAAPPLGELRWKRPEAPACWSEARPASEFGPVCTQLAADGSVKGQEDCLTINVWTPDDAASDKPAPVLFYVHGGGNVQGSSGEMNAGVALFDGENLATVEHAVVVTFNYRVGPFGFLAHPGLSAENGEQASGNYGGLDQLFALGWVKDNIAAFGGDPARVLLFGESAGGLDTCILLATPRSKGLFSAALIESGGCAAQSRDTAESFGADFVTAAGCDAAADAIACLRELPAEAVELAIPSSANVAGKQGPYQPSLDGYFLPKPPLEILKAGEHQHVPFVIGANENETATSVGELTEMEYGDLVALLFGPLAQQVLVEYPVADYPSPRWAYIAVTSDAKFICPARTIARAARAAQSEPVYRYHFTHVLDNVGAAGKAKGAFHGLELLFVFNHLDLAGYQPSQGEKDLAGAIGGYWTRLAAGGDPNGPGAPAWPVYDVAADSYLELATPPAAGEGVRSKKCDFWDDLLKGN
jgi:para-nitrobenzyl esterase